MDIKDNIVIRALAKPVIERTRWRAYKRYLRSPDRFYLKTLKGIHAGKRCFVIGNGPSLTGKDLDELCGEYTFAANRIFKIFQETSWRPSYYMTLDLRVIREVQEQLKDYELGHIFVHWSRSKIRGATNKLTRVYCEQLAFDIHRTRYNDTSAYFSEDVSDHFSTGWTVTFAMIQLAVYMGFTEIYLLGVDHSYSHTIDDSGKANFDPTVQDYFDNRKYKNTYPARLQSAQYSFEIAKEYCDNHGIKIFNATRGGKLEVFERVDFDTLMMDRGKE